MKNFAVFVEGENYSVKLDGKVQRLGFFATRRVEAENGDQASSLAITMLAKEPELSSSSNPASKIIIKVVQELDFSNKNEYTGFTFFPMEES